MADFAGAAIVTAYADLGKDFRGHTLDADLFLQTLRFARTGGGGLGTVQQADLRNDFPTAGQFLVHYDQHFDPGTGSGEVCMSEGKALQYVRDYSTLGEGAVTTAWREATGQDNQAIRRVAAGVESIFRRMGDDIERARAHSAQFVYGQPYVIQTALVGRVPK